MISTPRSARRLTGLAVAAVLGVAACGGGDDIASSNTSADEATPATTPATEPPVTEPATTEPPATDPPATDPPATTPPATEPPATEPATTEPPADGPTEEFCAASRSFYLPTLAIDYIDFADTDGARQLFAEMRARVEPAIALASDENSAAQAERSRELLDIMIAGFESVDFDLDRLGDIPDTGAAIDEFGDVVDNLENFLEVCGFDEDEVDRDARALADEVAVLDTTTADSIPDLSEGSDLESVEVLDDNEDIKLSIPVEWTQVDGAPDGEFSQIVASADADAFLNTFTEPGVAIFVQQNADGAAAADIAAGSATAAAEDDGCTVISSDAYDDGAYTGTENTLACDGTTAVTRIIGGTNSDEDLFFLVLMVHNDGDEAIRDLIVETFLVR